MRKTLTLVLIIIIAAVVALKWVPLEHPQGERGEIRAAIDIGSGATNIKVAKVDSKTDKIITEIFQQSIPVPYQKHLELSSDNTFDRQVMDQGIQAIKVLKESADKYGAKKVIAVATAAFRKASNAPALALEIKEKTGVEVRIIDQDEEGILAFRGALALTPVAAKDVIVWDIGGGSMQLTTLTSMGTYLVDKGTTASIPYKNAVIEQVEKKDIKTVSSPNPLSKDELLAGMQLAESKAADVDPMIKEKIKEPGIEVLAVGNLFNYGVKPLVKDPSAVHFEALETAVMAMAGKTDAELPGGSLVEVTVTNPLMVVGYMKALGIEKVKVVNVNNTDGALTYPAYWQ